MNINSDAPLLLHQGEEAAQSDRCSWYNKMSNSTKAILFINIYCITDTLDNINAKNVYAKNMCNGWNRDVNFLDIAFSRFIMNFIATSMMVMCTGKNVWRDVPAKFRTKLTIRSILLSAG